LDAGVLQLESNVFHGQIAGGTLNELAKRWDISSDWRWRGLIPPLLGIVSCVIWLPLSIRILVTITAMATRRDRKNAPSC
jgi:hypothetical protein